MSTSKDKAEYIELLSTYNLKAEALDNTSTELIVKNDAYHDLIDFFTLQYKNSEEILNLLRESKERLDENRLRRFHSR